MNLSDFKEAPATKGPNKHYIGTLKKNFGGNMAGDTAAFDAKTIQHLIKHDAIAPCEVPDHARAEKSSKAKE